MDKQALAALSSEQLLELHRRERDDEDSFWDAMWMLRNRGGTTELEIGLRLASSKLPVDREIAADLLGQLGGGQPTFLSETVDALLVLLDDPSDEVIAEVIINLGHRSDTRAADPIIRFAHHPDPEIRYSVAFALGGMDHPGALRALLELAADSDLDTRNWAIFGLGSLTDVDTPELREALVNALDDADPEIRGEALVGLARRGDQRVVGALLHEWRDGEYGTLSLEAAEEIGSPDLVPRLSELLASLAGDPEEDEWRPRLEAAISACEGSSSVRCTGHRKER